MEVVSCECYDGSFNVTLLKVIIEAGNSLQTNKAVSVSTKRDMTWRDMTKQIYSVN